jgi:hypothetical protein
MGKLRDFDRVERASEETEWGLEGPAMIKPFLDSENILEILTRS